VRDIFFPDSPRKLPGDRAWRVGFRTIHIVAMGVLLGGLVYHVPAGMLFIPILLAVGSGVLLLALDLWKSCAFLYQGAGLAVLLKLALLGLGHLFPSAILPFYFSATVVASIGSHMSSTWRHFSIFHGRVLNSKDEV
jgi:hypothetical protein